MAETLTVEVMFGGGAELLFNKVKRKEIALPPLKTFLPDSQNQNWTLKELLIWLKDNLLVEREELFLKDDSVRPGILVLINEEDWELHGQLNYELKENDKIMFISTLHGG
ncbi:ubiquitin-related modifier 1 homolog [Bombyx mori]|uniref:Ubiquitin-related modifier 1 homolog n=1 Tax=Bombyx mori TaxID=7091 RepID=URM1_BOMMO|nr:ubiquitin-related modifier 1 homolog [Bombyx mori]Q1HQ10.1 RecName: Full=Ubiquitin-related modifier 1 homolog [Bombyx mori]ABF51331.1 ubiquitin related modifier [Bombyx mori]